MLARVRESLFAILGDVVEDAAVLDLFSGTGSLGLEALSRGAAYVRFFERDRRASGRLAENIAILDVGDCTKIVRGDALNAARWAGSPRQEDGETGAPGPWAQIALLDPPYPLFDDSKGRATLIEALGAIVTDILTPGGVLVLHTHPRVRLEEDLPQDVWKDRRVYGNTALWFLWKPSAEEAADAGQAADAADDDQDAAQ
ncbi:MAG: 16S rRNA (guanine966-N2)-methyltransferase [Chlamydiales bacterium]|jgi:16S rRNA (guanine966-N2)-methyltransferase